MKTDPICGMTVDERTALSAERDGRSYYFCCEGCRRTFLAQSVGPAPSLPILGPSPTLKTLPILDSPGQAEAVAPSPASCCGHGMGHGGRAVIPSPTAEYFCPMCPGVESDKPGVCPKCGMALERARPARPAHKTIYTCPMHPEVQQDQPGDCPKCGMALEPATIEVEEGPDPELTDMTRRFVWAAALAAPLLIVSMGEMVGLPLHRWLSADANAWLQLALATPVVLWAGLPLLHRGVNSLRHASPNMFTLILLGVGAAYGFSLAAVVAPGLFPASVLV
ncbi:MAG TPA: heavy metal-binding domain-containing protein, partial [Pirellulales bacterium]